MFRSRATLTHASNARFREELSRRTFLAETAGGIGKLPILIALPTLLLPRFAMSSQVSADDPRIRTEKLAITAEWGKLECYLARPKVEGPLPGVILAHDKLGLTPHFEDVARRLALEGFIALAPDYASRFGGTPSESGPALEVVGMTKPLEMTADTQMSLLWLKENGAKEFGAMGFGLGGTAIGYAAAKLPDLMATVIYYGHPTPLADVGRLKAPILLNLAGKDQFIDPEIPDFVEAMKNTGVKLELYTYEGTVRGFDDDSAPAHYSADAAKLAWSRTIGFLKAAFV